MWQRQKVSLILSVKHGQRSASEKKNEPYFLMAARKVCSIRSMGCCWQRPWRMFDLSPLLLWSEEKLCSWAVSPCLRNTQQRCAWRELAKGLKTKNIQPSEIPFYRWSWMVRLMAATNEGAALPKTRAMDSCYIYWSYLTTPVSISVSKYEEIHSAQTIHIVVLKKAENNSCLFVLVNKSN